MSLAKLQGVGHRTAPIILIVALATYIATWLQPAESRLSCAGRGVGVIAYSRCLATMFIARTVKSHRIQQKLGNAYVSFLTIATSDVLSLVLIFNAHLFKWMQGVEW